MLCEHVAICLFWGDSRACLFQIFNFFCHFFLKPDLSPIFLIFFFPFILEISPYLVDLFSSFSSLIFFFPFFKKSLHLSSISALFFFRFFFSFRRDPATSGERAGEIRRSGEIWRKGRRDPAIQRDREKGPCIRRDPRRIFVQIVVVEIQKSTTPATNKKETNYSGD